jgi:hypothetical protein
MGLGDALQQLAEAGQVVTRRLREIGAAEERPLVRCEEHGQRPPAGTLRQHVVGRLVDLVDVRPLLPVHLDVDEQAVHDGGNLGILERLVRHHVTPVTCRVPDREQDRLVLLARQPQRFLTPGMPIHRIVGVLLQVGAGFVGESVTHADTKTDPFALEP